MATTVTRIQLFVLMSILLLFIPSSISSGDRRNILAYNPPASRKNDGRQVQVPDCGSIGSRGECTKKSRWCRWCSSETLDDMCFTSVEAWRLPHQVFSCEHPKASA